MAEQVDAESKLLERLRRSEQTGRFAFWEWDVTGDRITWSRRTASLFGIERAPTSYEEFLSLIHPEDRSRVRAEVNQYLGEGGAFEHEFRVIGHDGKVRWILDRGEATLAPDGRPLLMFGINIDLTAQRRTEAALRLSEAGFRAVFENAAVGIASIATDGRLLMVNDRMCEILRYSRQQLLNSALQDLTHPEDLEADSARIQAIRDGDTDTYSTERRFLRNDGGILWGKITVGCVRKDDGEVDYLIAVLEDLSERKRADEALHQSEQRLRLAQEVAGVGTFEWNIKDNVNRWSPEIEKLYGLPESGFGGTYEAWARRVHPDDLADAEACVQEALQTGEFDAEWRVVRPNGEILWVQARAIVEKDALGRPIRMIGANFDITERKEAEQRQALLTREIDHRAKNALAVVQSVVRLTRADNTDDFVAAVEGRIGAVARAHTLLAESGWGSVNLLRLIECELAPYDPDRVVLTGGDVVLEPEAAQPFALAIHELVTNAAKYGALSATAGRIEVSWSLDPTLGVRMTWRESGGPRVQRPAREGFGTTLIATALERQLGGRVRQDWNPTGLVCELVIPIKRTRGPAPRGRPHARSSEGAARVLVVEDDMLIALDVAQTLADDGHEVVGPVGSVANALQIVDEDLLDAAVLDANLGGETAAPLAERLRGRGIPFVIATGYETALGFDAGGAPVLTKPVATDELRRTVAALLAYGRPKDEPTDALTTAQGDQRPRRLSGTE